jgi:hypothetical protein
MPECDYCAESFGDEDSYIEHLKSHHEGELGPIDRRRIGESDGDDDSSTSVAPLIFGGIFVSVIGVVVYVTFIAGGNTTNIGTAGSAHYHGTLGMTVLNDSVDFSREKYQLRDDRFHFEGDGRWHAHATGVTLAYGMESLGIDVTADSVSYNGTNYTDGDGYAVSIEVNGQTVTPQDYVLQDGDQVRISVREA